MHASLRGACALPLASRMICVPDGSDQVTLWCRFFETFSFLPPLDDAAIAKQVDYIIRQGWIPALEFADVEHAYVKNDSTIRFGGSGPCNYYDNRYVACQDFQPSSKP